VVEAVTHFQDPEVIARVSTGLRQAMPGIEIAALGEEGLLQTRGW
jgi:pyridoxal 5'-phosphate synthase pdxS subunit